MLPLVSLIKLSSGFIAIFSPEYLYRGYFPWNTLLGGQTPCFSTVTNYFTPPPIPSPLITALASPTASASPKATSAIVNVVYAMYYPVNTPASGISTGAQAGIGAGAGVAAIAIVGLVIFFLLRRIRKNKRDRNTVSTFQSYGPESAPQTVHPTMSQNYAPQHQGVEHCSAAQHQSIEHYSPGPVDPVIPLGGYLPQDNHQYPPRPAYQNWPPLQEQHWQTSQGIYPSPPTSTASPPPGSFNGYSSRGSYGSQPHPAEMQVAPERQELLGQSRPRGYEMST